MYWSGRCRESEQSKEQNSVILYVWKKPVFCETFGKQGLAGGELSLGHFLMIILPSSEKWRAQRATDSVFLEQGSGLFHSLVIYLLRGTQKPGMFLPQFLFLLPLLRNVPQFVTLLREVRGSLLLSALQRTSCKWTLSLSTIWALKEGGWSHYPTGKFLLLPRASVSGCNKDVISGAN